MSSNQRWLPIGFKAGDLEVIGLAGVIKGRTVSTCRCACGRIVQIQNKVLRRGIRQDCGCKARRRLSEEKTKHGMCDTPEHNCWMRIISRCHRPGDPAYADYGGRGITVCDRWRQAFVNFLSDMGRRPAGMTSIDRIDNDKGYNPENCRWATQAQQTRNYRRNRNITVDGVTKCAKDWAAEKGLNYQMILERLNKGVPPDRLFSPPDSRQRFNYRKSA